MKKSVAALSAAFAVALLVGCTSPAPDPAPDQASEPAESATPSAEPTPDGWVAPAECEALDLTPGVSLAGADLGACVATALSSYGSGREWVESSSGTGEVVFRYDPEFEMQGTVQTSTGPMTLTFLDGTMWIDSGAGPVKGDVNSSDQEEMLAGLAGELYRIYSDPAMAADLISAGPTWTVGAEEDVTLGNGESVRAFPIVVAAPFTWNEFPVADSLVWFASDWTPVGVRGTVSLMGQSETTTQTFYDLGEPVEIVPVG